MAYLNENYLKLKAGYLFPEIGRRVAAFTSAHPEAASRQGGQARQARHQGRLHGERP